MPAACIGIVCYPTIEDAIDASQPDDFIVLEAGIYHAAAVVPHDLHFFRRDTDDVIIRDGIDGQPILRVTNGATVTVWNIALASSTGRVFDVEPDGWLELNGVFLWSNAVVERGGIGRVRGGTLFATSSLFVGGLADVGGQLYVEDGHVEITGSSFRDGFARTLGGAVALWDTDGIVDEHIITASFEHDVAANGGAVYVSRESVVVSRSRFDACGAEDSGGVLFGYGSHIAMTDTVILNTDVPSGAALHLVSDDLTTSGGTLSAQNVRISGGQGAAIYTHRLEALALDDVMVLNLDGQASPSAAMAMGVGLIARENASTNVTRSWFCGNRAPGRPLIGAATIQGGNVQLANNRFAFNDVSGAVTAFDGTGGTARLAHNDFVANGASPVSARGSIDTILVRANIITGHAVSEALLDYESPRVLVTDSNLFWDNGIAPLTNVSFDVGEVGNPELQGYDASTACQFSTTTASWAIPGAPFARWRSAGTDGDAQAEDPDGTAADLGAGGGPYAMGALWLDPDSDGWPNVYDCPSTDDLEVDAAVNPGVAEIHYNGIDEDCDAWYDYDADRDGHVALDRGGDDCDDTDPDIRPSAAEIGGNQVDENCDGNLDGDGDGFEPGDEDGDDCNDLDPTIFPGRSEDADTVDRNCDGIGDVEAPLAPRGCGHAPTSWPYGLLASLLPLFARRRRIA